MPILLLRIKTLLSISVCRRSLWRYGDGLRAIYMSWSTYKRRTSGNDTTTLQENLLDIIYASPWQTQFSPQSSLADFSEVSSCLTRITWPRTFTCVDNPEAQGLCSLLNKWANISHAKRKNYQLPPRLGVQTEYFHFPLCQSSWTVKARDWSRSIIGCRVTAFTSLFCLLFLGVEKVMRPAKLRKEVKIVETILDDFQ